jgi:hypothetical protein
LDWISAVDSEGRTTWIADAHLEGKRFVAHADEVLIAFLELDRVLVSLEVRRKNLREDQAAEANYE